MQVGTGWKTRPTSWTTWRDFRTTLTAALPPSTRLSGTRDPSSGSRTNTSGDWACQWCRECSRFARGLSRPPPARSGAQPPGRAAGRAAASLGLLPFERCPVRFVIRLSSVVLCPARTTATCRICVTKPFPLSIADPFPLSIADQWTGPRWLDPAASMPFREVQLPRGAEFRECLIDHCEELVRRFGDAQQGDDGVQVSA